MPSDIFTKKYAQIISKEKERFFRERFSSSEFVRPIILESWRRCLERGQNCDNVIDFFINSRDRDRLLEASQPLLTASRPIIENFFSQPVMERASLSLVNEQGVLLQMWYNQPSFSDRDKPGLVFTEQYRGTGALTLAVATRQSQECFASEHFHTNYNLFYSCASPVYDIRGKIRAFISMGTLDAEYHYHIRMLCRIIAQSIASQIHLQLLLDENSALLNAIDDAMFLLDPQGYVIRANDKAITMLGLKSSPEGKYLFNLVRRNAQLENIPAGRAFMNLETRLQTPSGVSVTSVATFSKFEKQKSGVLFLKEVKSMREYAARTAGGHAIYGFEDIIGRSPQRQEVIRQAKKAAKGDITVLIMGESGTGKELVAHSIHNAGSRRDKPFITVNCGALPRDLVQAELFGYSAGAFTGAKSGGNPGKFELADGGTLFLDEIGEMPLDAQVSLLRLLQNGEFTRIGGKTVQHANVRIIAATNRDLEELVRNRIFREDLFYRLNAITLRIPALRERPADLEPLAQHFLSRCVKRNPDLLGRRLSKEVLQRFEEYDWPGNVRELENTVEYAVYMAREDDIRTADLPAQLLRHLTEKSEQQPSGEAFGEREELVRILQKYRGNVAAAAKALGVTRSLFYRHLALHGIRAKEYRELSARNLADNERFPLRDIHAPARTVRGDMELLDALLQHLTPQRFQKLISLLELL